MVNAMAVELGALQRYVNGPSVPGYEQLKADRHQGPRRPGHWVFTVILICEEQLQKQAINLAQVPDLCRINEKDAEYQWKSDHLIRNSPGG